VSALYWACYVTEFDVLEHETKIDDSCEDEEGWGILGNDDDFYMENDTLAYNEYMTKELFPEHIYKWSEEN
jgi:hypothetical protein